MSFLTFLEDWIFAGEKQFGRALLLTCKQSRQIYIQNMIEAIEYVAQGLAGICGLRSSVQPRDGNINTVPYVQGFIIDNDSPDNPHVARITAVRQLELVQKLGGDGVIVFTGGKGYTLRVFLDKEYRNITAEQYKSLVSSFAIDMGIVKAEVLNVKALIRVPYTVHEKSKARVLLYNPQTDKHIDDHEEAHSLFLKAMERPLPFYEELIKVETSEKDKQYEEKTEEVKRDGRRLPKWVEKLIEHLKETGTLCHYARVALARWLIYAGYSEDAIVDIFRYAKNFRENMTRYHIQYEKKRLESGEKPWSCRKVAEQCPELELEC